MTLAEEMEQRERGSLQEGTMNQNQGSPKIAGTVSMQNVVFCAGLDGWNWMPREGALVANLQLCVMGEGVDEGMVIFAGIRVEPDPRRSVTAVLHEFTYAMMNAQVALMKQVMEFASQNQGPLMVGPSEKGPWYIFKV